MTLARQPRRPTRSVHHQRRQGLHQKRNDHFMKTYWPYLPMMMLVIIGLAINGFWTTHSKPGVLAYATEMSISNLLADTNSQRVANGEASLNLNSELDSAAQAKANDMVARDYWSHNTPDGVPPWTFITNAGYQYSAAGENLAYGFDTSADTLTGWMNSPDHRANILDAAYKDVGFGYANSANFVGSGPETVVVAEYAAPAAAPAPAPSKPVTPAPAPAAPTSAPPAPTTPAPTSTPTTTTTTPTTPTTNPAPAKTNATTGTINSKAVAEPASQKVSRIQLTTAGAAPWSLFVASTMMSAGLLLLLVRHGLGLRRMFVHGEAFILKHQLFDVLLVGLAVAGFVLSRTAGVIR